MISDILALIDAHAEAKSDADVIATARDAYRALERLEVELGGDPNESVERARARVERAYVARGALASEAREILETISWRGALACFADSLGKTAPNKPARKKPARKKASRR